MKNLGFLAVMALIMMFGCSKDEMTTGEQELFSVEKNSQPVIDANRPGSPNSLSIIQFLGKSNILNDFYVSCFDPNPFTDPEAARHIYQKGNFSGKLVGFGKINSKESEYIFTGCDKIVDYNEWATGNYDEKDAYEITGTGKIYLTARDYCNVTISFILLPNYYPDDGFDGGNISEGVLTINEGETAGKLEALNNKIFNIYRDGVRYPYGINLTTGEIGLRISENIQGTN